MRKYCEKHVKFELVEVEFVELLDPTIIASDSASGNLGGLGRDLRWGNQWPGE